MEGEREGGREKNTEMVNKDNLQSCKSFTVEPLSNKSS